MNRESTARIKPETNTGGRRTNMDLKFSSSYNVPRDEIEYERRIFDLECQVERLEYLLMMTECERDQYKRQICI